MNLILSTRQSPLALWQAQEAQRLIEDKHRDVDVSLLPVTSSGDKDLTTALSRFGRVGIFTAEVDSALLENRAHLGVHSLKDLTTKIEDGLCLAGVLPSGPTEDVLVTVDGRMLDELPAGSKVATSSQRRKAQLLRLRPDLSRCGNSRQCSNAAEATGRRPCGWTLDGPRGTDAPWLRAAHQRGFRHR